MPVHRAKHASKYTGDEDPTRIAPRPWAVASPVARASGRPAQPYDAPDSSVRERTLTRGKVAVVERRSETVIVTRTPPEGFPAFVREPELSLPSMEETLVMERPSSVAPPAEAAAPEPVDEPAPAPGEKPADKPPAESVRAPAAVNAPVPRERHFMRSKRTAIAAIAGPPRGLVPTRNVARAATVATLLVAAVASVFVLGMFVGRKGPSLGTGALGATFAASGLGSPSLSEPSEHGSDPPSNPAAEAEPASAVATEPTTEVSSAVVAIDPETESERANASPRHGAPAQPSATHTATRKSQKVHALASSTRGAAQRPLTPGEEEIVGAAKDASDLARAQLEASMR